MFRGALAGTSRRVFLLAACVAGLAAWGSAGPIDPGFDLFATQPGTFVELPDGQGGFVSVALQGVPVGPLIGLPLTLGDTDTIVERTGGLPPGGQGVIPIELVALSLKSVEPVDLSGTQWDLEVLGGHLLLGPSGASPPGLMNVTHTDPLGGTFSATLPVQALLTFTEVGNPLNTLTLPWLDTFFSSGVPWSHNPAVDYPAEPSLLPGGFFPSVDFLTGSRVLTQDIVPGPPSALHLITPATNGEGQAAIPEPGTLSVVGLGLLGFVRRRCRRS